MTKRKCAASLKALIHAALLAKLREGLERRLKLSTCVRSDDRASVSSLVNPNASRSN